MVVKAPRWNYVILLRLIYYKYWLTQVLKILPYGKDIPTYGTLQAQQGGSFVISTVRDDNTTPPPITQNDPYLDNIYAKEAPIEHYLIHPPVRISGDPEKQAIKQWQKEKTSNKSPSVLSAAWQYIKLNR